MADLLATLAAELRADPKLGWQCKRCGEPIGWNGGTRWKVHDYCDRRRPIDVVVHEALQGAPG